MTEIDHFQMKNFLEHIVENLEDPISIVDHERRWIYANTAFYKLVGLSPAEILGHSVDDYMPASLADSSREADKKVLQTGHGVVREEQFWDGHGKIHHLKIHKSLYVSPDKKRYVIGIAKDIGSLKQTQMALEQAGNYHRTLFETCPMGLALCRIDGQLIEVNPAYAAITGHTVEELMRLSYYDITPPKYIEEEKLQLESLQTVGRYGPYEKEYIHKNGSLVPVRLSGVLIENMGKKYIWSSIEDISDKKKAEKELQKTHAFLNSVLENIPQAVYVKDARDLRYILLNKGTECILGWTRSRVLGKMDTEIFSLPQAEKLMAEDREVLKQRKMLEFPEQSFDRPDEHTRYLLKKKVPVFDSEGQPRYVLGIAEDITNRKISESALRELKQVFDHAEQGISRMDSHGNFTVVNTSFAALHGFNPEDLKGRSWRLLVAEDDQGAVESAYARMFENGIEQVEIRGVRKDGSGFHEQLEFIRTNDEKGNYTGCYLLGRDISIKKMRDELDSKAEIISMVSHEFRTPMHCIKEGVSSVLDGLSGPLTPEQKDALVIVSRSADRLVRLIRNFLDYQRIESGQFEINRQKASLSSVAEEVRKDLEPLASKKGLAIEIHCLEGDIELWMDRDRITQVLWNLASNAIKFSETGPIIIRIAKKEGRAIVSVKDHGIGIKTENLPKLFKKFGRLHDSRVTAEGTGLGLAITERIIREHGGMIWAESEYGKGSTFFFELPLSFEA